MLLGEKKISSLTELVNKKEALTLAELEQCLFHLAAFKFAVNLDLMEWREIHVLNMAMKVKIEAMKERQKTYHKRIQRINMWLKLAIILESIACAVIILLVIKEIMENFSV